MLKSLVSRITLLCSAAMALFTALFIAANQYAVYSMRNQVVDKQAALLAFYTSQLDGALNALRIDMVQYIADDLDLITLSVYSPGEDSYLLNLQACQLWLQHKVNTSEIAETHFIYADGSQTLLTASKSLGGIRNRYLKENFMGILSQAESVSNPAWNYMATQGYLNERDAFAWVLVKAVNAYDRVCVGAIVSIASLIPPLQNIGEYEGQITLVCGSEGELLESSGSLAGFSNDLLESTGKTRSYRWVHNRDTGEDYAVVSCDVQSAPIRFVSLLPQSEVLRPLSALRTIGAFLPGVLLIMVVVTALLIRRSLHNPFRQMIGAMSKVSSGDLTARLPMGKTTEFMWLNAQFNDMVDRIGALNRDVSEQTARAHRAEIRHLQAQISPHFFHNTLNLIHSLAALKKHELIQKTALYLAEYFRFTMRSGDCMITIQDELRHIANYMELQKIRYPGAIGYTVRTDEDLLGKHIFPLLIQPFVENSVVHGYTTQRLFEISVVVSGEGGCTVIEIDDNGNGISDEMIRQLNDIMQGQGDQQERHIGVWNVANRLRRYYGGSAKLVFLHKDVPGTYVRMELPALRPEGMT